jgi:NifU-like protein involved in Fe-S cluster formation
MAKKINPSKELRARRKSDVLGRTKTPWVYSRIVREHFFNPHNFMKPDEEAKFKFNASGMVGSPACVLGESKIHTNPAIKEIAQILPKEKVLTHTGEFDEVVKIYESPYQKKLIQLENQLGRIISTPDHLIYGIKINRPKSFFVHTVNKKTFLPTWWHANDLEKGDVCLYPIPQKTIKTEYLYPDLAKAKYDFKSKKITDKIKITKELLEFFGYFVAEGYTKKTEVGLVFGGNETKYAIRVKNIVKKIFGLDVSIREREQNRIDVSIYNVYLAKFMKGLFGDSAATKHLPDSIIFLPPNLQKSFILGVWRGDGYINLKREYPRAGYSTISYNLAQQLKWLLLRQNIVPSIYTESPKLKNGVYHKKCYRIHIGDINSLEKMANILRVNFQRNKNRKLVERVWIDKNYVYSPIRKKEVLKSDGNKVYNLEVKNDHSFVSEAFILHNCGDVMRFWLKIDPKTEKIKQCRWRTFGCGAAIGSTSMLSVMITEKGGMSIEKARKIKPQDIIKRLGGLPEIKYHCSVLGDKALRSAINDYFRKANQPERIIPEEGRIIDPTTKTTDRDIEVAVLEGADTLEKVQEKTKVGVANPKILAEVEQLIRFYKEKYSI